MTATITSVDSSSPLRVVLPLSAVTAASPVTAARSPSRARLAAGATAWRTAVHRAGVHARHAVLGRGHRDREQRGVAVGRPLHHAG